MNRIVIIGNGFDKSHGLPTGYSDFLDHIRDSIAYYKKNEHNSSYNLITNGSVGSVNGFTPRFITKQDKWIGVIHIKGTTTFKLATNPKERSIYFSSLFQDRDRLGSWADLEAHYYKLLIKHKDDSGDKHIILINEEFDHLKKILGEYLKTEIEDNVGNDGKFPINMDHSIYEILKQSELEHEFSKTYFITFNYTSKILNKYYSSLWVEFGQKKIPTTPIHIHGDLTEPKNPIIFGYGDENSDEYRDLELLGNNELLKNFKTFQYLRSNKYNQVLGLLENHNNIYVQIIGHSCGLCDKALLRSIFQHDNVTSIEPIYHSDESKYFENLYNISRIFDDNTLMRKKLSSLEDTSMISSKKQQDWVWL